MKAIWEFEPFYSLFRPSQRPGSIIGLKKNPCFIFEAQQIYFELSKAPVTSLSRTFIANFLMQLGIQEQKAVLKYALESLQIN